ncbi:MAG: DNA recombination protein RmuC [bacterium]
MEIFFAIISFIIGAIIIYFYSKASLGSKIYINENMITNLKSEIQKKDEEIEKLRLNLDNEKIEKVTSQTRLENSQKNLEEQKKLFEDATLKLKDTFNALSAESLKNNNQIFLEIAKNTLENFITEAKGDLNKRQESIDLLIKPLKESLDKMENARQQAYGGLEKHLENLSITQEKLQKETTTLSTALRNPKSIGKWGEITLKRVVEISGMSSYCDFVEQYSMKTDEEKQQRPDLIVKLPEGRNIVIDAKISLESYTKALETNDESLRKEYLENHADNIKKHIRSLGNKAYWKQFNLSPDFVVLFLPGECFFSAALEQNENLIEEGIRNHVIIATPTTIITLLKTIAYAWQQQEITQNTQQIWESGKELFDRLCKFIEYFNNIKKGLCSANQSYNEALSSWNARVMPGFKKFKELKIVSEEKKIPIIEPIETYFKEIAYQEKKEENNGNKND